MRNKFTVNASRILLLLASLASIGSLGGGALVLPPFKSVPWFTTSNANIGLWGGCLKEGLNPDWYGVNSDWKELQALKCQSIFIDATGANALVGQSRFFQ